MDEKPLPRSKGTNKQKEKKNKKKSNTKWIVTATSISFVISAVLSAASDKVVDLLPVVIASTVLIFIISLGIVFDIIGLAVATADIAPFNSMAARRLKTGQKAVWLINNAEKVSSFCNDIVGDIAGIVSGATGSKLIDAFARWSKAGGKIMTGLVNRRLSEANMYLNQKYSRTPPENYCYVILDVVR